MGKTSFKHFLLAIGTLYNPPLKEPIAEEKEIERVDSASVLARSTDDKLGKKYDKVTKGLKVVADMFKSIDTDNSGEITMDEMQENFAGLGLGDRSIYETRMQEMDFNRDKEISYAE